MSLDLTKPDTLRHPAPTSLGRAHCFPFGLPLKRQADSLRSALAGRESALNQFRIQPMHS